MTRSSGCGECLDWEAVHFVPEAPENADLDQDEPGVRAFEGRLRRRHGRSNHAKAPQRFEYHDADRCYSPSRWTSSIERFESHWRCSDVALAPPRCPRRILRITRASAGVTSSARSSVRDTSAVGGRRAGARASVKHGNERGSLVRVDPSGWLAFPTRPRQKKLSGRSSPRATKSSMRVRDVALRQNHARGAGALHGVMRSVVRSALLADPRPRTTSRGSRGQERTVN